MEDEKKTFTGMKENHIEGRNAVLEAFRSGKTIDKLYVLDGCQDGPVRSITREARKHDTIVNYVTKERLDQISETGKHQGVIAVSAAYDYARVEDILALAEKKGEPPFILILDGIEDPHNLGAIIRTANQSYGTAFWNDYTMCTCQIRCSNHSSQIMRIFDIIQYENKRSFPFFPGFFQNIFHCSILVRSRHRNNTLVMTRFR